MEFAEARAAFFQPRDDAAPSPDTTGTASPARRLRHVLEPLAMVHIWSEPGQLRLKANGLDFLGAYVGTRACVLGDVEGGVVAAAFGVFEPGLIADLWGAARAKCGMDRLRSMRTNAGAAGLIDPVLEAGHDEMEAVIETLRRGTDAADLAGKPLFAGLRSQPWPTEPLAQLWHAATLWREHRGDAHLAACVAAGVDGLEANILTELRAGFDLYEYTGTRGWSQEAMDAALARLEARGWVVDKALTADGRAARDAIEDATDRAQERAIAALGDLEPLIATLTPWADGVVARGWFPPDPYKRAAG